MKRPSFVSGAFVALILAGAGAAAFAGLALVTLHSVALKLVITLLAGAYMMYLLSRSEDRQGRVAVAGCWGIAALAAFLVPGLLLFAITHVIAIWLVRALYFHSGAVPALADLGLSLLALGAAAWASSTGSIFITLWTFFLVEALFIAIPATVRAQAKPPVDDDGFLQAQQTADYALRRIASRR